MRRIAALGAVLVLLLAAAPVASADSGKANPGKSDEARAEHQATTKFWTKERVRQAKPRDFVRVRGTDRFVSAKPGNGRKPPKDDPPVGDGDGGSDDSGDSADVTGAPWDGGGTVADVTGKVFFQLGEKKRGKNRGPLLWVCSATAVDTPAVDDGQAEGRTLILTAAHCVYDNQINQYAENWMFIPDYDNDSDSDYTPPDLTSDGSFCERTKYGCWTSSALVLHDGFISAGGFNTTAVVHDFAFAAVEEGGMDGETLLEAAVLGSYPGLSFEAVSEGDREIDTDDVFAFGYPAGYPYDGTDLTYCRTDVAFDLGTADTAGGTYGLLGCTLNGGSSGGSWQTGFSEDTGNGTLMSVNSYTRTGTEAMYGPKFNETTEAVFNKALGAGPGNHSVG